MIYDEFCAVSTGVGNPHLPAVCMPRTNNYFGHAEKQTIEIALIGVAVGLV